jgi:GxxExxY protein
MPTSTQLIEIVKGIAFDVHRELGPGLLESAYERIFIDELRDRGVPVESQLRFPLVYKGREITPGFRVDLLLDRRLVVEFKSTERPAVVHSKQLLTYLRCLQLRHGLLVNMGMERALDGIDRVVNFRIETDHQTSLKSIQRPVMPDGWQRTVPDAAPVHAPADTTRASAT